MNQYIEINPTLRDFSNGTHVDNQVMKICWNVNYFIFFFVKRVEWGWTLFNWQEINAW